MKTMVAARVEKIAKAVVADAMRRTAGTGNFPADADFAFQADYDPDDKEIQQWYEDATGETIDGDDSESVEAYKEWVYQTEANDDSEAYREVKSAIDELPTYAFWEVELGSGYYAGFYVRIVERDDYVYDEEESEGEKDKEYDKVYNAVKEIAKDNGMKSYAHGGTFSNGETIYRLNDID